MLRNIACFLLDGLHTYQLHLTAIANCCDVHKRAFISLPLLSCLLHLPSLPRLPSRTHTHAHQQTYTHTLTHSHAPTRTNSHSHTHFISQCTQSAFLDYSVLFVAEAAFSNLPQDRISFQKNVDWLLLLHPLLSKRPRKADFIILFVLSRCLVFETLVRIE